MGLDGVEGRALELMFLFGFQLAESKQAVARAEVKEASDKKKISLSVSTSVI